MQCNNPPPARVYIIAVLLVLLVGAVGFSVYVHIENIEFTRMINDTGKMRALTRELQLGMIRYGLGQFESDDMLQSFQIQEKLLHSATQADDKQGGHKAQHTAFKLITYCMNYTKMVDQFYVDVGVNVTHAREVADTLQAYAILSAVRVGAAWLQVLATIQHEHEVYQSAFLIFDDMTSDIVEEVTTRQLVSMVIFISLASMMCAWWVTSLVSLHLGQTKQLDAMKERAYFNVIKNLNHELKGFIARFESLVEESAPAAQMLQMTNHLGYCLNTLSVRCQLSEQRALSTAGDLMRVVDFDIMELVHSVQAMLPDIVIVVKTELFLMSGDPAFFYAIIYQLCRNACVHGSEYCRLVIYDKSICVENGVGKHHHVLSTCSEEEAIHLCMSGTIGTKTSSNRGIADVLEVCELIEGGFRIRFLDRHVVAEFIYPSSAHPREMIRSIGINVERTPTLLIIDDQKVVRLQSKYLAQKLGISVPPASWDVSKAECRVTNQLFITGHASPSIEQIVDFVQNAIKEGNKVFCLMDYYLEYNSGNVMIGTDIIKALNSACGDTKSLFLYIRSGNDNVSDEVRFVNEGAHGLIPKTMKLPQLIRHINSIIA